MVVAMDMNTTTENRLSEMIAMLRPMEAMIMPTSTPGGTHANADDVRRRPAHAQSTEAAAEPLGDYGQGSDYDREHNDLAEGGDVDLHAHE